MTDCSSTQVDHGGVPVEVLELTIPLVVRHRLDRDELDTNDADMCFKCVGNETPERKFSVHRIMRGGWDYTLTDGMAASYEH